jgi:hypothetical protein
VCAVARGGRQRGFDDICSVFDSCDDWLANGPLADGHRWVLAGLDFRFDA